MQETEHYCENHTKHICMLCEQFQGICVLKPVIRSTHSNDGD